MIISRNLSERISGYMPAGDAISDFLPLAVLDNKVLRHNRSTLYEWVSTMQGLIHGLKKFGWR